MSRSIKKSIAIIFEIIQLKFDLSPTVVPHDFYADRWIHGSKDDGLFLAKSTITDLIEVSSEKWFGLIEYDNKSYFFVTGFDNPDKLPIGIEEIILTAGAFSTITSELELPIKFGITNLHLENNILSQSVLQTGYNGHDFNDLVYIFPNIFFAEITLQYAGNKTNLSQIVCAYLTLNKKFVPLPYSIRTLNTIYDLVLLDSDILNYDSIIHALLSAQFKFSFLDIYRCVEMLYQVIYVDETHSKLSLVIDKTEFLIAIDEYLKWKPNERGTISKLFQETPKNFLLEISSAIQGLKIDKKDYSSWLYDLRCSVVHLKSSQKTFKIKSYDWDKIINGICHILQYWYGKYKTFK